MESISAAVYAVVCLVYLLAGVIDGVSGGGGLISIPSLLVLGVPAHLASGTNVCGATFGSVTAAGRFIREKKVYWPMTVIAGPLAGVGAILGARLNLFVPEHYLQMVMIVLLPIIALVILMKRDLGQENHVAELTKFQQRRLAVVVGLGIGIYNGFYGAGAGTFYLLAFAVFGKLDLVMASGSAKICGLFATVLAAVTYALSGQVMWLMALVATLFNVVGNYIGAGLAIRKGAAMIRPVLIGVLTLLFGRLLYTIIF